MLVALSGGIGLLIELACGRRLPGVLLPSVGLAGLVAIGALTTATDATAELTVPVTVAAAAAGYAASFPWRDRRPDWWAIAAAVAVLAVFAAPVVLSGEATFAGYIKLDDTATWLAFTDQVMQHGHSTAGLAPSSFEATVQINFSSGYPLGAFVPLGIGHELAGTDSIWLVQPYMATLAAIMSLCLFHLCRRVVGDRRLRAAAAFLAAQAPLLFGYSLWGGVKEVITASLLAVLAVTAAWLAEPGSPRRAVPAAAIAAAAVIAVMGLGGMPWVVVVLALALAWAWRALGLAVTVPRAILLVAATAVLALPPLIGAGPLFSPDQNALTSGQELGNLVKPLNLFQYVGPWLNGDFRYDPSTPWLTVVLIAATLLAWLLGAVFAVRRRSWGLLLFALGVGGGSLIIWLVGSPWVQGKAMATGTASFLLVAMAGIAAALAARDPRLRVAGALLLTVPAGVLVSNAFAFHDVYLAPRPQLAELEQIGHRISGQGPTLMTEYQPYGVRHLLRDADPEGASELRRRPVTLRDGSTATKGEWVDTDRIALPDLLVYRTLVLRRSPGQSRPPEPYRLTYRGDYYDVWQRPAAFDPSSLIAHMPLGTITDPSAVPSCARVLALARRAGSDGQIAAVSRLANVTARFVDAPPGWALGDDGFSVTPSEPGTARAIARVPAGEGGRFDLYVGGSARGQIALAVDGVDAGTARDRLNNNGQYIEFDSVRLAPGRHEIELTYEPGGPLVPGTGGTIFPLGPVILAPADDGLPVSEVPASRAAQLCGMRLDWVEALRG